MLTKPKVGKLNLDKKFSDKLEMIIGCKANIKKPHSITGAGSIQLNKKYSNKSSYKSNINKKPTVIKLEDNNATDNNYSEYVNNNINHNIIEKNNLNTNMNLNNRNSSTSININIESSYKMSFIIGTLFGIGFTLGIKLGYLVFFVKVE